jgi:hypothetical protein
VDNVNKLKYNNAIEMRKRWTFHNALGMGSLLILIKIKKDGNEMKYIVTREFTNGTLKGMRYTGTTKIKFEVGFIYAKPCAGDSYKIISCNEVKEEN